jgi:hypothetical protein
MTTTNPTTPGADAAPGTRAPETAAVWIDDGHAMVARMDADGRIRISRVERGVDPELTYLAAVVHAIGDRRHVAILGPGPLRLALEREYVAIVQRPDRLVDVEPSGPIGELDLVERLARLEG